MVYFLLSLINVPVGTPINLLVFLPDFLIIMIILLTLLFDSLLIVQIVMFSPFLCVHVIYKLNTFVISFAAKSLRLTYFSLLSRWCRHEELKLPTAGAGALPETRHQASRPHACAWLGIRLVISCHLLIKRTSQGRGHVSDVIRVFGNLGHAALKTTVTLQWGARDTV